MTEYLKNIKDARRLQLESLPGRKESSDGRNDEGDEGDNERGEKAEEGMVGGNEEDKRGTGRMKKKDKRIKREQGGESGEDSQEIDREIEKNGERRV